MKKKLDRNGVLLESHSNENSFEKTDQNVKRLGILKVIGKSMLGKLKPGAKVGFEIKNENDVYEIGDIIVFNQDDVNIIHEVISYYIFRRSPPE